MSLPTDEFVFVRMRELREFFQARLGKHWMRNLRRIHASKLGFQEFYNSKYPSVTQLRRLERCAAGLGWKPSPFERKSFSKMLRTHSAISAQCRLNGLDPLNFPRLCAITYHKKRCRLLRDDVLSEEWRNSWCQEQRISNPVLPEPAPEKAPKRFALDLLLAEETQQAKPQPSVESLGTSPPQPIVADQNPVARNPTGGGAGPGVSLSAPRAFKNLSREDLHVLVNKALDQLKDGDRDTLPPKLHVLSCIARRIEGILRSHEPPEDAG